MYELDQIAISMTEDFLHNARTIVFLSALAVGISAAMIGWVLSRALAAIPEEDRQYKDAPPLGFLLAWLPIQWLSHYLQPFIPAGTLANGASRLRKAGLGYCLSPAQFLASRCICGLLCGALCLFTLAFADGTDAGQSQFAWTLYLQALPCAMLLGALYPGGWLKDRLAARRRILLNSMPFYLDIITLCVEAGLNLQGAMQQAVAKGPKGPLREEFQHVLRDVRAGRGRAESLRSMAQRTGEPAITHFTMAVIQAESMGMSLGPVLRAQADQRRTERFLRAEKLALEAPVKMLLPLIAFIFPCTFIVLFFPIVMKFMESGL
ncbi:MAG TPA: type II secretion system F family protein [Noviherbaspirillum sp.]|jgi:tight adherence protein C|uniref:type II secretion system F family protein n=1 Tax=Noviherbaspirillum sp. TaxID=1926288 RepID=UPI002F9232FF